MSINVCPCIHSLYSLWPSAPPSTSSPARASCHSSASVSTPTPVSSPVPFSAPPTPSYTPCCTPRRHSLALSLAESSTNLRDSTKTTSTSLGLVRLLLERGISSSVYDPLSWDRGFDVSAASASAGGPLEQQSDNAQGEREDKMQRKCPESLVLQPGTPPNSPRSKSASFATASPAFQFSPANDDPPFYDTFLASKPACTILREVLGETEREQEGTSEDDFQAELLKLRLVDKLKSFHTLSAPAASISTGNALLSPFGPTGLGNSALAGGLPGLNAGLRRNRSYPAMVGASMAMKDPGGPPSSEILIPHSMQGTYTQLPVHTEDVSKTQANKSHPDHQGPENTPESTHTPNCYTTEEDAGLRCSTNTEQQCWRNWDLMRERSCAGQRSGPKHAKSVN